MRKLSIIRGSFLAALLTISFSVTAFGQSADPANSEDLERPPSIPPAEEGDVPIPPKIQEEQIEPTVTIREEKDRRIEEYRMNGQVYMVKVTPKDGVSFYYIDADGDGKLELDVDKSAMDPVQPVYWKVKEWK